MKTVGDNRALMGVGRIAVAGACFALAGALPAAEWIAAAEPRGVVGSTSFLTTVTNARNVVRAVWRTSGLGVYEA